MGRRRRVHVTLVLPPEPPTQEEIDAVLMATDAVIGQAGRSGVTLILNGSRSKKALRWDWNELPDYGRLDHLTADEITHKIDWCIHNNWLSLEHNRDGIPLLYHAPKGWERVKQLWVERLLGRFEAWQAAGDPDAVWPAMKTIHPEIKELLVDRIAEEGRRDLAPVLRAWFPHDVRKARRGINRTLQALGLRPIPHARATG